MSEASYRERSHHLSAHRLLSHHSPSTVLPSKIRHLDTPQCLLKYSFHWHVYKHFGALGWLLKLTLYCLTLSLTKVSPSKTRHLDTPQCLLKYSFHWHVYKHLGYSVGY